jgi:hypothetical protein
MEANGWDSGVRVVAHFRDGEEQDEFNIFATTGSGHGNADGYIGKVVNGKFVPKGSEG